MFLNLIRIMSWQQVVMLTLALNVNVVAIADDASGLQQTQVENVRYEEVSTQVDIGVEKNIRGYPMVGVPPLTVMFDASISSGGSLSFAWDLGDGHTATGVYVEHTYNNLGDYTVTLTVANDVDSKTRDF